MGFSNDRLIAGLQEVGCWMGLLVLDFGGGVYCMDENRLVALAGIGIAKFRGLVWWRYV